MDDDLKIIKSITDDLNKIKKDLDTRQRLRDQLVGKFNSLLERLLSEYELPTVELAEKELNILKADIQVLSVDCERKLIYLKQKIKEFDERPTKVAGE